MDGPKLFLNGVPKPIGKTIFRSNLDGRSADHSGGDMPNCRSFVTQNFLSILGGKRRKALISLVQQY